MRARAILGNDGSNLILRLQVEGQETSVETTWADLVAGNAVGFFEVPHGTLLRPKAKRIKRRSMKQERQVEKLGGKRQSGSGSRTGYKSDGRISDRYRIENKFTTTESFRVELSDLVKIRSECSGLEVPVFEVQFLEPGTLRTRDTWVLIPRKEWEKHVRSDDSQRPDDAAARDAG